MLPELQDVVDEVSRLLGTPAVLEDRAFRLVAHGAQTASIDPVRQTSILQRVSSAATRAWFEQFGIATSEGPVLTPPDAEHGTLGRLCLPARSGGVTQGYLWLVADEVEGGDGALAAALELARRAGRLLARSAREQQAREERLVDLYGDDRAAAVSAAAELVDEGLLRPGASVVVLAVRTVGGLDGEREPVRVPPGLLPGTVLAAGVRGHTALLVPVRDAVHQQPARETAATVVRGTPAVVVGIGGVRRDVASVHESWTEARLAAHVAATVPSRGPVAAWADLGAYRLLRAASGQALAEAVIDDAVRVLLADPDDRLASTALCYLEHAGNAQRAAAALSIHRQTLYYRLRRVEGVTGLDLSDGQDRLRLHLGLLLDPLAAASGARP